MKKLSKCMCFGEQIIPLFVGLPKHLSACRSAKLPSESKKVKIEDENVGSLPVGGRLWRCNLVVNAWRKCKMKSVRIYGWGAHASERS